MQFRIFSEKLQRIAAEGDGVIVSYNYRERRKAPIPQEVRRRIEELEGRTFTPDPSALLGGGEQERGTG